MSNTYAKEKLIIYELFKSIGKIECPAFPGEYIIFNSKGANHILFKGDHKRRNKQQRQIRLSLVKRAVSLISEMPYYQEYQLGVDEYRFTQFWAFEGIVESKRIKVIIRQIGDGNKHFYSVIPAWKSKKSTGERQNFKRDLGNL